MFDRATLDQINRDIAIKAAAQHKTPFVPFNEREIKMWKETLPFPELGDYCPPEWELVDKIFCDSTGHGAPDELANNAEQFIEIALENYKRGTFGYGIINEGEFQCYVGVFLPPPGLRRKMQREVFTDHK